MSKKDSQDLFDFIIRQIELSIREIGYGDVSVNKKMKDYVNLFYSILETSVRARSYVYVNLVKKIPRYFIVCIHPRVAYHNILTKAFNHPNMKESINVKFRQRNP